MSHQTISRETAKEAAHWLSILHSGEASSHEQQACQQWRQARPEHEQAWSRAQTLQEKFGLIPQSLGMDTLNRQQRYDRRQAVKALAVLIAVGPATYATYRYAPSIRLLNADYRTDTGEQQQMILADGTQLHLNTATSVDVKFTQQRREVILHRGEIFIETAKDLQQRPFLVTTSQGSLRPIGTRFILQTLDKQTRLRVLQGSVEIRPEQAQPHTLLAGEQTEFDQQSIALTQALTPQADAWKQGVFYANNLSLAEFVQELSRYRSGSIRCEPSVENLRISGVFQLDNIDRIVASLPDTLPVVVNSLLGVWLTIKAR
jgi:transmembrane sensor